MNGTNETQWGLRPQWIKQCLVIWKCMLRLLTSKSQGTQPIPRDLCNDHGAAKHLFSSTWAEYKSPWGKMSMYKTWIMITCNEGVNLCSFSSTKNDWTPIKSTNHRQCLSSWKWSKLQVWPPSKIETNSATHQHQGVWFVFKKTQTSDPPKQPLHIWLPKTNIGPENGDWETTFLLGFGLFSGGFGLCC